MKHVSSFRSFVPETRNEKLETELRSFNHVRKMWKWKLVARRSRSALYGRRISLGRPWWPLGTFLWPGRNSSRPALDARRRPQARLRADERAGVEVRRYL